jgi:homoserine kinase
MPATTNIRCQVSIPASTSNIGPGFDFLGCAFQLRNEFSVEVALEEGESNSIIFNGPQSKGLNPSSDNLLFGCAERVFERIGEPMPPLRVRAHVEVPNARGLGSSATATVAGILAANFLAGEPLTRDELLEIACDIEGHPDNVAPALLGGMTGGVMTDSGRVLIKRWMPHPSIGFVLVSPDYEVPTRLARAALPKEIPLADAIANATRIPLLVMALIEGDLSDLQELTRDRWHEPYRAHLFRSLVPLKEAAFAAGAASVTVSGAGPSLLAITEIGNTARVAEGWRAALSSCSLGGTVRVLEVDRDGAILQPLPT